MTRKSIIFIRVENRDRGISMYTSVFGGFCYVKAVPLFLKIYLALAVLMK